MQNRQIWHTGTDQLKIFPIVEGCYLYFLRLLRSFTIQYLINSLSSPRIPGVWTDSIVKLLYCLIVILLKLTPDYAD